MSHVEHANVVTTLYVEKCHMKSLLRWITITVTPRTYITVVIGSTVKRNANPDEATSGLIPTLPTGGRKAELKLWRCLDILARKVSARCMEVIPGFQLKYFRMKVRPPFINKGEVFHYVLRTPDLYKSRIIFTKTSFLVTCTVISIGGRILPDISYLVVQIIVRETSTKVLWWLTGRKAMPSPRLAKPGEVGQSSTCSPLGKDRE